jgi:hypothetical protein
MTDRRRALELFISYSHQDEDLRQKLDAHLALLDRQAVFTVWHDRRISAGREWAGEIDAALERADVVLLLVSSDFLASDYCYDKEMTRALARHEEGTARVIPVILRPCDWQSSPFGKLRALPASGKPVTSYPGIDAAFTEVAVGLRTLANEIRGIPEPVSGGLAGKVLKIGWPPRVVWAPCIAVLAALGIGLGYYGLMLRPRLMDARNALRRAEYTVAAQRMKAMPAWSNVLPFVSRVAAQADFGNKLEQGTPIRTLTPALDELGASYPDAPDVLVFQGLKAYYVDQDPEKARQRFKAAADRDSAHVEAHFLAAGRDIDLAYVALSRDDLARAQALVADARLLMDRATRQSSFATALPRYANQIGALDELEGDNAGAYAVYEKLLALDPQSALAAAFVSWRLPAAGVAMTRSLEGLEQARGRVAKNSPAAEGWSFRVQATELVDVRPQDEKLCLLAWAYDVSRVLQRAADGEQASEHDPASARMLCGEGAVAARTREIVCVQVMNAQHALPPVDARQAVLETWRTNQLRCGEGLRPLPVLAPRAPEARRAAGPE